MGEEEGSSDVMLCRPMSREVKAINTAFLPGMLSTSGRHCSQDSGKRSVDYSSE